MMFGRRISLRLKAQRHRSIAGDVEFAHTPDPANGGSWRDAPQMERAEPVCVESLAGVLCQLDPNELPGLLQSDRGQIDRISARRNILDFEGDDIAATQFAVDRQIEHRQVARPSPDLQLGRDRPDVFWPSGGFAPITLLLFQDTRPDFVTTVFSRSCIVTLL